MTDSACIIMRSHNDMPLVAETLAMVAKQAHPHELFVFDNESSDGTREEAEKYTDRIFTVPKGTYVPGRVLNHGMRETHGEFVVFLNSDCTPVDESWLEKLLVGFRDEEVAAVFGQQIPRPDCQIIHAKDTYEAYGDGSRHRYWKHAFSMASSAIRRSLWEQMPFNEDIQYSEDLEWTYRIVQKGHRLEYVADSVVYHSHSYTLRQLHRRHRGEGKAEAVIFDWAPWERAWLRYSLLPCARQVVSDWKYCLRRGHLGVALQSPVIRFVQMLGRRKGFREGWRAREEQAASGA